RRRRRRRRGGVLGFVIGISFCAPMNFVDEDASSGSGDDANMLDGHKRQSGMPSSSGRRKRSRKATGDAIVDAMLEIAAASKMRATAIMKNEDRFSINNSLAGMDDYDLDLDEMELVAAAAGYYYYNSITKQPRNLSPHGSSFMTEVLNGHDDGCREMFRMDKHVFHKLCDILRQRGMLRDTAGVMIEEQLAIFLNIIEILGNNRFFPYFKDCIGVIDGMQIPAHVPAKDQSRFRNRKGSAADSRVLRAVLDDPDQNFPQIPEGKYYLVDTGYSNMEGFLAPYQGVRDIVIAACVLHNYIRREERNDWLFTSVEGVMVDELPGFDELPDMQLSSPVQEQVAFSLRESIAAAMWDDFINNWDEW
ncbi:hypothetical protein CMV_030559, partial [Castanea mollissima]